MQSLRDAVTEAEATLLKIQQEMLARASSEAAPKSAEGIEAAGIIRLRSSLMRCDVLAGTISRTYSIGSLCTAVDFRRNMLCRPPQFEHKPSGRDRHRQVLITLRYRRFATQRSMHVHSAFQATQAASSRPHTVFITLCYDMIALSCPVISWAG